MIDLIRAAAVAALTFGASAAFACGGTPCACDQAKAQEHAKGHDAKAPPGCGHGAQTAFARLSLNAGKKWSVDAHTKAAGARLRETIQGAEPETIEAAHGVARQLHDQLTGLIRGCTMKGPDHDMLHVFLSEFMPAAGALGKAKTLMEAKVILASLSQGIDAFDAHFE